MVEKDMTIENSIIKNTIEDPALKAPLESLKAARELRKMRRAHGIDYIDLVVDDVDGDWLEQWGEDEVLNSEEFQEKLSYFTAIARREEFQKDIQKIEEKITETDQEIEDFRAKFIQRLKDLFQTLPVSTPEELSEDNSDSQFTGESKTPLSELSISQDIDFQVSLSNQSSLNEKINQIKELESLLPQFQLSAEDNYKMGNALLSGNYYDQAILEYEKAIELSPKYAEAWHGKGISLKRLQQYELAIKAHEEAIRLKPDYAEAWNNKGLSLSKLNRFDEAIIAYEKAIKINPKYINAWNNKGVLLRKSNRFDKAVTTYEEAIKLNPEHARTWNNKGFALAKWEKYDDAIIAYDKAIELDPNYVLAWYNKGISLRKLGRYEESIAACDKAIKLNPSYIKAWKNKGNSLKKLGRYEEAVAACDEIIKLNPSNASALYNKACYCALLNNLEEVINNLKKAINLDKGYISQANIDPDFDLVRNNERFKQLLLVQQSN
jgi:tetratricopeptide (TPR) repeat protein